MAKIYERTEHLVNRQKFATAFVIIVLLLVIAVICAQLTAATEEEEAPEATPTPAAEVATPTPEPTATPTPSPVYTPSPTPTPAPTPESTPTPTPEPTPEVVHSGEQLGSGTFVSNTGVGLNLRADWSVVSLDNDQVTISIKISTDSYAMTLMAVPYAVKLCVGEQYVTMDGPELNYSGGTLVNTPFGATSFTVNAPVGASVSIPVAVEWHYGGTYSDAVLDIIECGGYINISR